jgi:hypothetical protein
VIITTNLALGGQRVRRSQLTTKLLDRITQRCDFAETGNDSWRFINRS